MGRLLRLAYTPRVNAEPRTGSRRPHSSRPADSPLRHALRHFEKRLFWTVLYFAVLLAIGATGYHGIEGWSWFESFYMAVITASSVGFSEIHPLTDSGRTFTMGLLAFSVVGLGMLWAVTTAFLVDLDFGDAFRKRRMMRNIHQLSGHFIVCGAGRMGRVIVEEMLRARKDIVVVESSAERTEALRESHPDLPIVEGDATLDSTLETAGLARAKGLAACLRDDADNVFLCLTARAMNAGLEISARAAHEESVSKLRRAGANHVVSPNVTGGARIAATLIRPTVVSFLDATTIAHESSLRLEETTVPAGSHLAGKTLAQARIPQETGLVVIGLQQGGDAVVYNPGPETALRAGDVMIVLGHTDQIRKLSSYALR